MVRPQDVLETPKPAGEAGVCRRGVIYPSHIMRRGTFVCGDTPCFLCHPSSHLVLLACRLRGFQYTFPRSNDNTGFTPCAKLCHPFGVHRLNIAVTFVMFMNSNVL